MNKLQTLVVGMRAAFSREGLRFFLSRVPSMLFWGAVCTIVLTLGQSLYERNVTGDYLLNVQSATVKSKVTVGENIPFTLCRKPRYDAIISNTNVRTFYLVRETGQEITVDQRILPKIAYEVTKLPCVTVEIAPINAPQVPGIYKFCQQITFTAYGYDKQANYCSTEWQLLPKQ